MAAFIRCAFCRAEIRKMFAERLTRSLWLFVVFVVQVRIGEWKASGDVIL